MKIAVCATRGHVVTDFLFARVCIPQRAIYEVKFFIAEYIETDEYLVRRDGYEVIHKGKSVFMGRQIYG